MASESDISPNLIMELTHGVERTEMIYNATKLRLFDVLERYDEPATARDVTKSMGLPDGAAEKLERLMNICANFGLLKKTTSEDKQALYYNTPGASAYLTAGAYLSLLNLVDAARHQFDLAEMIQADERDVSRRWFFDVKENAEAFVKIPHRFRRYYLKQDGYSKTSIHLLKSFDLHKFKTVVDLGGSLGAVSRAYKDFYPEAEVTCYDMPRVIEMAKYMDEKANRNDTISYLAGDLFSEDDLPKADLYIVGHLLHMFEDKTCQIILNKVRTALNDGGAILVLEKVMNPDKNGPELCLMYDMRMNMSDSRGDERTAEEYKVLLEKAGMDVQSLSVFINEGYNCYDAMLCHKL